MNDADYTQLARGLAAIAARKSNSDTEKVAAALSEIAGSVKTAAPDLSAIAGNPYLQNALLGAGAGGLIGLIGGKKKRRNILNSALLGGLTGVGLTAAKNIGMKPATPPPSVAAAGYDNNSAGAVAGLAAAGAGATGGHYLDRALNARGNLSRMLESNPAIARQLQPALDRLRHTGGTSRVIQEVTDHVRAAPLRGQNGVLNWLNLRGDDYMPRDVGNWLESAGITRPADVAGRVNAAQRAVRNNRIGGVLGGGTDAMADLLAGVSAQASPRTAANLRGADISGALRRAPRYWRHGRWALPLAGALSLPAIINSLSSGAKGE